MEAAMHSACTIEARVPVPAPGGVSAGFAVLSSFPSSPGVTQGGVMLLGNFDGFHRGHAALKERADEVASWSGAQVGIMSCEPHPRQFFQPDHPPFRLSTAFTKRTSLARLGFDFAWIPQFSAAFAGQSAESFAVDLLHHRLGLAHLVVGEDFRFGHGRKGNVDLLTRLCPRLGMRLSVVPAVRDQGRRISSSLIRAAIAAGDLCAARHALGQEWVSEAQLAQTPNGTELHFAPSLILPPPGSYRARLSMADRPDEITLGADRRALLRSSTRRCGPPVVLVRWLS
jgi:riboflavin kinase/FMN adenylyltransferase